MQEMPPLTPQPMPLKINNGINPNKLKTKANNGQAGNSDFALILLNSQYKKPKKQIAIPKTIIAGTIPNVFIRKTKLKKEKNITIIMITQPSASDFSAINISHF